MSKQALPPADAVEGHSLRRVILTTGLFGSSSLGNLAVGMLRVKLCAVLLGPSGIALVGVLGTLAQGSTIVFGLGLRGGGVRELAASPNRTYRDDVRRALTLAHVGLGILAATLLWAFRTEVAILLFGDTEHASLVAWSGVGVLLTLVGTANTAVLQGLRHIRSLALGSTLSTLLGSSLAVAAVYAMGMDGIWLFVLGVPAMSALVSAAILHITAPLPTVRHSMARMPAILHHVLPLGLVFMVATVLPILAKLWGVSAVYRQVGTIDAGLVQVTWTISMQYIGLVMASLASDYYPRLSAAPQSALTRMVNDQARVSLLIGVPLVIALIALADVVVPLMYSRSFTGSVPLVQWNLIGDLFRIISWPLGFLLLSKRSAATFLGTQLLWFLVLIGSFFALLPTWGTSAAPASYLCACAISAIVDIEIARRKFKVSLSGSNKRLIASAIVSVACVTFLLNSSIPLRHVLALSIALFTAFVAARKLATDFGGRSLVIRWIRKLLLLGSPP
jgi:PST family polysaccharide transporter